MVSKTLKPYFYQHSAFILITISSINLHQNCRIVYLQLRGICGCYGVVALTGRQQPRRPRSRVLLHSAKIVRGEGWDLCTLLIGSPTLFTSIPVAPEGSEETNHWGGASLCLWSMAYPLPHALFAQSLPAPLYSPIPVSGYIGVYEILQISTPQNILTSNKKKLPAFYLNLPEFVSIITFPLFLFHFIFFFFFFLGGGGSYSYGATPYNLPAILLQWSPYRSTPGWRWCLRWYKSSRPRLSRDQLLSLQSRGEKAIKSEHSIIRNI